MSWRVVFITMFETSRIIGYRRMMTGEKKTGSTLL
jgi:hypothetical protein